ncbi:Cupredoxin [Syntrophomonas zehnderi OL-4]|uniref:Cupredoxin n=1 Tax=Syntrophomonas zehnderi OL-4 TaxID=690567 RepID=A0A0E4GBZ8_9FIRM|nr:multicopper oxidase [Syntrophomonas zehnderi]CFX68575.1 Cupredoxin [Syntrophomonas zehnderi OL-4]
MATINPITIQKYVNNIGGPPPVHIPSYCGHEYMVDILEFQQQILPPGFPATTVWGYGGQAKDAVTGKLLGYIKQSPGATFEATRNCPLTVKWINKLSSPHLLPVDPTLHWADPNNLGMVMCPCLPFPPGYKKAQYPVPVVTHLHGGEVPSAFDGHPEAWFTHLHNCSSLKGKPKTGPAYITDRYIYPNRQQATTLWYHDHTLGITRLNVLMGLAGFYLLRDPNDPVAHLLPSQKYEIPLVIQDRTFNSDGSFFFPNVGIDPDIHPYWVPEFFGDTIMVNSLVWPNLDVEPTKYRFRLLNGSNARFYTLSLSNGQTLTQIGTDGGYLPMPVTLSELTISPGERADILIDFSALSPGTKLILMNTAPTPFPNGDPADPQTTGQIMQFTVVSPAGSLPVLQPLPETLNIIPTLTPNAPKRTLTLVEVMGPQGPLEVLLNGQKWSAPISEFPELGTTEEWEIVNLTGDTHPIHLHLVQFQLFSRQLFDTDTYMADWMAANGGMMPPFSQPTKPWPVDSYLIGDPMPPRLNEQGWKDTVQMNPGEVTTIKVRFAEQSGSPFPFDATKGPGYVWHCHILDHEDNEMMRPYKVVGNKKCP